MQTARAKDRDPVFDRLQRLPEKTDYMELLALGGSLDGFNLEWVFDRFEQNGGWQ